MKQAGRTVGDVEKTAVHGRPFRLAFWTQVNMCLPGVDLLAVTAGENHVPLGFDLIGRTIGAEGDRGLIG